MQEISWIADDPLASKEFCSLQVVRSLIRWLLIRQSVSYLDRYNGVCYNELRYNEQFLSIKSGYYNEHRRYNERWGTLSPGVARACASRVEPSRFD
jgi:hypothetical protein